DQLVHAEKMASLGQLTAGIAHEIQNPLNFVNNFSELSVELLNEALTVSNEKDRTDIIRNVGMNLEKISAHGKRADSIVKGMLLHSRNGTTEKTPTDINKLAEEYFNLAYHGMRAKENAFNCTMEKNLDTEIPLIKIIPQDISRVLLNFFNNAFYAVFEKSKTSGAAYKPLVALSTQKLSNLMTIRIRDNGTGIPKDVQAKIFQPFYTTKPTGEGTGLGLSLSLDIIKAHGGKIKVESEEGEGTEFVIVLPV